MVREPCHVLTPNQWKLSAIYSKLYLLLTWTCDVCFEVASVLLDVANSLI